MQMIYTSGDYLYRPMLSDISEQSCNYTDMSSSGQQLKMCSIVGHFYFLNIRLITSNITQTQRASLTLSGAEA